MSLKKYKIILKKKPIFISFYKINYGSYNPLKKIFIKET